MRFKRPELPGKEENQKKPKGASNDAVKPSGMVVSSSRKGKSKFRISRRGLIILGLGLVVLATGGLVSYQKYQSGKEKTVTIGGKPVTINLLTTPDKVVPGPDPSTYNAEEEMKRIETKATAEPTYENFMAVATAYAQSHQPQKAIEYYQKAKEALDPNSPGYEISVKSIEYLISTQQ